MVKATPVPLIMLRQWTHTLTLTTNGRGFHDLGPLVRDAMRDSGIANGLAHCFISHTSASLLVTENADPDVRHDLETVFARLGPDGDPAYRHVMEGRDDMAAHVRSALTQTEISIPVREGRLALGTWQGFYLWEHRLRPHRRTVELTITGAE
jgi:secondary thiamine-phosphate synthase enzyme